MAFCSAEVLWLSLDLVFAWPSFRSNELLWKTLLFQLLPADLYVLLSKAAILKSSGRCSILGPAFVVTVLRALSFFSNAGSVRPRNRVHLRTQQRWESSSLTFETPLPPPCCVLPKAACGVRNAACCLWPFCPKRCRLPLALLSASFSAAMLALPP